MHTVNEENRQFLRCFFEKNGELKIENQFCFDLIFFEIKKDCFEITKRKNQ